MSAEDIANVVNVVNYYAMALDSHSYALFDEIFTEDITCDFGGGAAFSGLETLKTTFEAIHKVFSAHQHMVMGHVVKVDGDTASCLSYVFGRFLRDTGDGGVFDSTGWYDDTLRRTPDGWRISRRISKMVSAGGDLKVMQAMPGIDTQYTLVSLAGDKAAGEIAFFK